MRVWDVEQVHVVDFGEALDQSKVLDAEEDKDTPEYVHQLTSNEERPYGGGWRNEVQEEARRKVTEQHLCERQHLGELPGSGK